MSKESHSGRDNQAKKMSGKEGHITSGGIETNVQGFFGNITTSTPFSPTYGNHKKIGSQMSKIVKGGRGTGTSMRSHLMTGGRGTKT